jgi:hypothetical protein
LRGRSAARARRAPQAPQRESCWRRLRRGRIACGLLRRSAPLQRHQVHALVRGDGRDGDGALAVRAAAALPPVLLLHAEDRPAAWAIEYDDHYWLRRGETSRRGMSRIGRPCGSLPIRPSTGRTYIIACLRPKDKEVTPRAITGFWHGGHIVGSARLPPSIAGAPASNVARAQHELRPPEFTKFTKSVDRIPPEGSKGIFVGRSPISWPVAANFLADAADCVGSAQAAPFEAGQHLRDARNSRRCTGTSRASSARLVGDSSPQAASHCSLRCWGGVYGVESLCEARRGKFRVARALPVNDCRIERPFLPLVRRHAPSAC